MLPSPLVTLAELIVQQAKASPDAPAIAAPGCAPLSYAGLAAQADVMARALASLGVGAGDRVATLVPNGPDAATVFLAVGAAATCAPLNPAYREAELKFYLEDLEARALVVRHGDPSPAATVARERGIPVIALVPDPSAPTGTLLVESAGAGHHPIKAPVASDIALVLHTSGTTARPKIVPLSHANLRASARNIVTSLALGPADRSLDIMPLFHIHGLVAAVLATIESGGSVFCPPPFSALELFAWLRESDATWYSGVPTMHQAIVERARQDGVPAHRLRFIRSSSSALPPSVMADLEALFGVPVLEAYGMTEAAHQMTSNPLPPRPRKPGSVGVAAGPEVAIMAMDGRLVTDGTAGEVVIRGANVHAGYHRNPEANATAFQNGWFRTGDEGRLDPDGYLYLTGRLKEMINRAGEKIAPREIDDVLLEHPSVAQAVAFAVPHPTLGEAPVAAVIPRAGASLDEATLRAHAQARLAEFKVPSRILVVSEIPKGPSGKVQRNKLAELFAAQLAVTDSTTPEGPVESLLAALFASSLRRARIGRRDNYFALGGDSLQAMVLLRGAADAGLTITVEQLAQFPTVEELARALGRDAERAAPRGPAKVVVPPRVETTSNVDVDVIRDGDGERAETLVLVDGAALTHRALADRVTKSMRVVGLSTSTSEGDLGTTNRPEAAAVHDRAAAYAHRLLDAKSASLVILGRGPSALVAFEVASRLALAGAAPSLLVLVEPPWPSARWRWGWTRGAYEPTWRYAGDVLLVATAQRARWRSRFIGALDVVSPGAPLEARIARSVKRTPAVA